MPQSAIALRLRAHGLAGSIGGGRLRTTAFVAAPALAVALIAGVGARENSDRSRLPVRSGLLSLPATARAPISAALGADDPAYRLDGLRAVNPAQRLSVRFARSGMSLTAAGAQLRLALAAYGRSGALALVRPVSPRVHGNHVTYSRGNVREWYTNGPLGLEQGFDVAKAPGGTGALALSLALSGGFRAQPDGADVLLRAPGGSLRYGGLRATDARGRILPSRLTSSGGRLLIRVDDRGAAYPIHIDPFVQQAELSASDGGSEDYLGQSVAISGSTIAVGAPEHQVGSHNYQGAVYVFTMPAGGWANATQTAELTASDGAANDALGASVAMSGSTIVAGAPQHTVGSNTEQGAVYVFAMPASGWSNATQTAELTASDGEETDHLGAAAAIDGSTVVAGAAPRTVGGHLHQGAAYVFTMPASGWANGTQTAVLTASDGGENDHLGKSVAIAGSTVATGAPGHAVGSNSGQGAVYVFTMPASGWVNATQTAELTAADGEVNDGLGVSAAAAGSAVLAGSETHAVGSHAEAGAAYLYAMPASGWVNATQTAELTASDGQAKDRFGTGVALAGTGIVVGAPEHKPGGAGAGAAYLFANPAPAITISAPAGGATYTQGQRVNAAYTCTATTPASIAGCTGPVAAGAPVDTSALGSHTFTVKALDSFGAETTRNVSYTVIAATTAPPVPRISGARESHSRWREGPALARLSARRRRGGHRSRAPIGTTFSFELNVAATVTFTFTEQSAGRRLGGRCVPATHALRTRRACTRAVRAGALEFSAHAGTNKVSFQGRLSAARKLNPGRYVVAIAATGSAPHAAPALLDFTIVR